MGKCLAHSQLYPLCELVKALETTQEGMQSATLLLGALRRVLLHDQLGPSGQLGIGLQGTRDRGQ